MCVVSYVGDIGRQIWPNPPPNQFNTDRAQPYANQFQVQLTPAQYNGPTKEQFEEFLKLLRAAKSFDTLVGLKDCESSEKIEWIKAMALYLGVDVKDIVS
jgi:hypothetical protein